MRTFRLTYSEMQFFSFSLFRWKTYLKNIWRHCDAVVRSSGATGLQINLRRLLEGRIVKPQVDTWRSTVTAGSTRGSALDLLRLLTSGRARALQRNSRWWDWGRGHAEVSGLYGRSGGLPIVQRVVAWCRFLWFRRGSERTLNGDEVNQRLLRG